MNPEKEQLDQSDRNFAKILLNTVRKKTADVYNREDLENSDVPVEHLVNIQLQKFYGTIKDTIGGDSPTMETVLRISPISFKSRPIKSDSMEKLKEPQFQNESERFPYSVFVDSQSSIEDMLKSRKFQHCLDEICDDIDDSSKSLENVVADINNEMQTVHLMKPMSLSMKDKPLVKEDYEILCCDKFQSFFRNMLEASRTEMKDVFEGDEEFFTSQEFRDFCIEIFMKRKRGMIDYLAEGTGITYITKRVKDDLNEVPVTDRECDECMRNLHLKSYYECVESNLQFSDIVEPLHRLVLIGIFKTKQSKIKVSHDMVIQDIQSGIADDVSSLSGILLIFEHFFLHVAEGCSEGLEELIERTSNFVTEKVLKGAKVVQTVYDIPNRFFVYWKSVCIHREELPLSPKVYNADDADLTRKLKELHKTIKTLACYVQTIPYEEFENKMQLLLPLDILPEENELNFFFADQFFLSVDEHIERYLRQVRFTPSEEHELPFPSKKV